MVVVDTPAWLVHWYVNCGISPRQAPLSSTKRTTSMQEESLLRQEAGCIASPTSPSGIQWTCGRCEVDMWWWRQNLAFLATRTWRWQAGHRNLCLRKGRLHPVQPDRGVVERKLCHSIDPRSTFASGADLPDPLAQQRLQLWRPLHPAKRYLNNPRADKSLTILPDVFCQHYAARPHIEPILLLHYLGAGNVQGLGILSVVEMVQGDSPHRASLSFPFHGFLRRLLRHSHCLIRRKRGSRVVISGWGDEQYPLCKAPQSTNLKNTHRLPSCERPKFLGERQQILPRMEVEII